MSAVVKKHVGPARTAVEVEEYLGYADAALGVAGHQVSDSQIRAIGRRQAKGELTGDRAAKLIIGLLKERR